MQKCGQLAPAVAIDRSRAASGARERKRWARQKGHSRFLLLLDALRVGLLLVLFEGLAHLAAQHEAVAALQAAVGRQPQRVGGCGAVAAAGALW
jgi:hypothetical protein